MKRIVIREAVAEDNASIMALAERCPQEGMITFLFKRTPRFNSINQLLDPDSWHYVACDGDRVVGVIGVMFFQARVLQKECKVAYILDLLLESDYRQGTTAFRLIKPVVEQLYRTDADLVLVNFLKENPHPLVFAKGRAGFPAALNLGDNMFYSMLSLYRTRLSNQFTIETPTEKDIPELVELYNRFSKSYKIAQVMSEDLLRHYTENIVGLELENFLVARKDGRIRAVTALWDEDYYRSYEVLRLNFTLAMVSRIVRMLSWFMKVPQPIRLNQPLSQLSLVMNAHDECPEALEDLFRHVNNMHRGSKYTLISMYAQQHDPTLKILQKFKGISVSSEMHAFARDPALLDLLREDPKPVLFNLLLLQ